MSTQLNAMIAQERIQEIRLTAERARVARSARPMRRQARPPARAWRAMSLARIGNHFARATAGGSH